MAVDVAPVAPPSAAPLHRLIRRARVLLRTTQAATGLALTVGLLLGAAALVVAADLLLPLLQLPYWFAHGCDGGLRLAALSLVVAPPAVAFLAGVVFPLCRRLTAGRVARRIEAHIPGIHNRLVSCIDLEARGRATASPVFYRRLVGEALERIRGFHASRVLDFRSLRRAGLVALVGAAAFAVVACLFSAQMPTAFARIFRPFDDIPPVGAAAYTVEPRGGDYLREEKIDFAAQVKRGQAAALTLELRAPDGTTKEIGLDPVRDDPSSFRLELDTVSIGQAFQDGFDYRVHGAGTWSAKYHVHLGPRPLITAVDTAVYYPAYMGIPEGAPDAARGVRDHRAGGRRDRGDSPGRGPDSRGRDPAPQARRPPGPAGQAGRRASGSRTRPRPASPTLRWAAPGTRRRRASRRFTPSRRSSGRTATGSRTTRPGSTCSRARRCSPTCSSTLHARPDEIMLEWHDGKGWEHRAYWGVDLIQEGKPGTESRHPMDKVPDAGGWVRLVVPPAAVGLDGKRAVGMAFKLSGGQLLVGQVRRGSRRGADVPGRSDVRHARGRAGPLGRPAAAGGQGRLPRGAAQRQQGAPTSQSRSCAIPP